MRMDKMTLKLKTATSLVVSALLGSPTAEAFAPSFAIREINMATTAIASHGMVQKIDSDRSSSGGGSSTSGIGSSMSGGSLSTSISGSSIGSSSSSSMTGSSLSSSTSGDSTNIASGTLGALHMSRDDRKRSDPPYRTPPTPPFINSGSQPSMSLSFRVEADMCIADTSAGSIGAPTEPLVPPEPGGISMSDTGVSIGEGGVSVSRGGVLPPGGDEHFHDVAPWACADDRPWRKRARHARKVAALGIDGYGWEEEEEEEAVVAGGGFGSARVMAGGGVGHGERRQRASEKKEVKASRKEYASKALQRNAMPIMDLVGVTAPLILIVGISIVQNGPGV